MAYEMGQPQGPVSFKEVLHRVPDKATELQCKSHSEIQLQKKIKFQNTSSLRLLDGFSIPTVKNDHTRPVFHFCYSKVKSSDWSESYVDFNFGGEFVTNSPTDLELCGGPL